MHSLSIAQRIPSRIARSVLSLSLLVLGSGLLPIPAVTARSTARATTEVDWPTYGYDVQRTGYNPNETILGVNNVGNLQQLWATDLGANMVGQAVLATGVNINGTPTDVVYMGAEQGLFYALNANTGQILWQRNLGSIVSDGCGTYGIDSTPALDRRTNRVYAGGGDDRVYALDLSTGAVAPGWPILVSNNILHEHIWSAHTLWQGKLYVPIASYCDVGTFYGRLMAIDTTRARVLGAWFVTGQNSGVAGGGIWGYGGASVDPANNNVYVETGNSLGAQENYGYAEHVVRLTAALQVLASHYPGVTGYDVDFGGTPMLYQAPGCPAQFTAKNKNGVLYIYNRNSISAGPVQQIQMGDPTAGTFQGQTAYSPTTHQVYVSNANDSPLGTYRHGMVALQVNPDCSLSLAWQQTVGSNGDTVPPPSVANGVVYYASGYGHMYAFNAATGQQLWSSGSTIGGPVYATPMVVNGRLYVGAWDHKLYAFGP